MRPTESHTERVGREDLVLFINAAFCCTRQHEFYTDAAGQALTIEFLHLYILGNYRRLYARSLAAGINHFNQALVLFNLLASGSETPASFREEEGTLIRAGLRALPPQRALRLLEKLRERRINNRRTRAVIRDYLANRPDPVFDAVKYRPRIRSAARHAHLELPGEIGRFLFGDRRKAPFQTEMLEQFRQASYSREAVYNLPYTVAEGLARKHGIPRDVFLARIEERMTAGEKLRLQGVAEQTRGVSLEIDLGRVPLTRLALYLLSLPQEVREARREELEAALTAAARRTVRRAPFRLGKVAAVLDRSYSSSGSQEKRRRPLAVALAASTLLRIASQEYRAFWTVPTADELLVTARGQTDLATPLLDALEWGAEVVVIVSDGYENDPPGAVGEIARVFRRRLDPERKVSIIHANPVFDSESYAPRTLGSAVPTVGLRDAEDLPTMLGFARFADGSAPLSLLEEYLAVRVRELLNLDGSRHAGRTEPVPQDETGLQTALTEVS